MVKLETAPDLSIAHAHPHSHENAFEKEGERKTAHHEGHQGHPGHQAQEVQASTEAFSGLSFWL